MIKKNQLKLPISDSNLLKSLLPHREPMIMVDTLVSFNDNGCVSKLTILPNNILVYNGRLEEAGLLEHMAQTAALHIGYKQVHNDISVKEGFIAAIKSSSINCLPKINDSITTELKIIYELGSMTIVQLSTSLNGSPIANADMSVVLNDT